MVMSIDIDGSIKELSKWRKSLDYDNGDYCYGDDTTKHSLDVAIETMRKYQQIEEIYKNWCYPTYINAVEAMNKLGEVLKDDKD